jgi:hypothetical protein
LGDLQRCGGHELIVRVSANQTANFGKISEISFVGRLLPAIAHGMSHFSNSIPGLYSVKRDHDAIHRTVARGQRGGNREAPDE